MDVSDALVAAVPDGNVRVPLEEFSAVWRAVEPRYGVWLPDPTKEGRITGIADTCRWLAGVSEEAPASMNRKRATAESIRVEHIYIDDCVKQFNAGHRYAAWMVFPMGRGEGVIATFAWARMGAGSPLFFLR